MNNYLESFFVRIAILVWHIKFRKFKEQKKWKIASSVASQ